MLILGGIFFAIAMILIIYYRIRRKRHYATWDNVFSGVTRNLTERGYDVKKTGKKSLLVSDKRKSGEQENLAG